MGLMGLVLLGAGCDESDPAQPTPKITPLFTTEELNSPDMVEIMACKHSHEHDLRYVRTIADPASAEQYRRCVPPTSSCTEKRFPTGSLFIKLEYDSLTGCEPANLISYTANRKLNDGDLAEGFDWQWQRLTPSLEVQEDGAPRVCVLCHIDHCSAPDGFDLRCVPD